MKPESIDESYEESQRNWCRKVKFKSPPRHEIPDIVVDLVVVHVHQLGDTDELNWKWKSINLQNRLWKWNKKLTFKVIKNWSKRKEVEEVLVEIMMKKHLDEKNMYPSWLQIVAFVENLKRKLRLKENLNYLCCKPVTAWSRKGRRPRSWERTCTRNKFQSKEGVK